MQSLFWCGTVILLSKVMQKTTNHTIDIRMECESVTGNHYTYRANVDGDEYNYHFSMESNTRLFGEFYISHAGTKSQIYTIEKQNGYYHISASTTHFDDVIFVTESKMIVVAIDNGKKTMVMTFSISGKGTHFHIKMVQMGVQDNTVLTDRVIRNMFMISGAVDRVKTILVDPVSYATTGSSMLAYSDEGRTIVGIEYARLLHQPNMLQSINTELGQYFQFKYDDKKSSWLVHEYTDGFSGSILKRFYELQVHDSEIIVNDNQKFSYHFDNGHLIFHKQ